MVFVALDVATAALEGWRWLEHVPQWFGAGLAVGGEMVERRDELVSFVADVAGFLSHGQRLHFLLFLTLTLVSVQDL